MRLRVESDIPDTVDCPNCGHKRWTYYNCITMVEECDKCGDEEFPVHRMKSRRLESIA